ncbi:hypothetical protein OGAPHI_005413 [Ogataea philodendri]|uniref:trans-L-3-hydroxyproline dehydratase n=1 Tax=Ogataea philodendri TaxID=1378263 RepID=A0A9P8T1P9_9ASCO|nr:uncharacterized protein OGAPHI_005413 [Ogataea philodendri]KAH3662165.1 hypothetical protein OGAPHI_005413 [Ogataea philodendri]
MQTVTTIESHTCGEPFRIVVDGIPELKGDTLLQKRNFLEQHHDYIRLALMREPRGHYDMFGGIILEAMTGGDAAALFMNPSGYTDQCGHGMIAIITMLIQLKKLPEERYKLKPDLMSVSLETTVGTIQAKACWNGKRVEFVSFHNTPVWILERDLKVKSSIGEITGDIVFNGAFNYFVEVDPKVLTVKPENTAAIVSLGEEIKREIISMGVKFVNKDFPQINQLHGVDLINYHGKETNDETLPDQRSALVFGHKQIDRSPCGSGTAGRTGLLYLKNRISIDHKFVNESLIGGRFKAQIVDDQIMADCGSKPACVVQIEGQANLLGTSSWWLDEEDHIGYNGFIISR